MPFTDWTEPQPAPKPDTRTGSRQSRDCIVAKRAGRARRLMLRSPNGEAAMRDADEREGYEDDKLYD